MNVIKKISESKTTLLCLVLSIIGLLFITGLFLVSEIFYDQFIWKYFWGPIVSDALEITATHNGVVAAAKFTIISEIVYGLLVITALYAIYLIFKRIKIRIDHRFFISIIPLIIYGTVGRVLEDSNFFTEPIVYWFVTPLIYFQAFFIGILLFFIGYFIQDKIKHKHVNVYTVMFSCGMIILIPFLYYIGLWFSGNQWSIGNGLFLGIFLIVMLIVLSISAFIILIARIFSNINFLKLLSKPLNISMINGHLLDGFVSYISIYDPFKMGLPSYIEKHPASDVIMQIWPPLFPIIKFLLIVFVIYVFDVLYKEDLKDYKQIIILLKIGIFVLGFAPGLRDLLRVAMGV